MPAFIQYPYSAHAGRQKNGQADQDRSMGRINGIDAVGGEYDKTPEIHERVIEGEYRKLEPYLNVYSSRKAVD